MPVYEYQCDQCEALQEHISSYESRPESLSCACGLGTAFLKLSMPNVTRATYLDGTKRFDGLRRQRELQRAERKARKKRDRKEVAKVRQEINQIKGKT